MPELPEVETVCRALQDCILNRRIKDIKFSGKNLRYCVDKKLIRFILGKKIVNIRRRAKYIIWTLENKYLILAHLGMSGNFSYVHEKDSFAKHTHIVFHLDNSMQCRYVDPRRFGFVLIQKERELDKFFGHLGVEPLTTEFHGEYFYDFTRKIKSAIKPLLMNNRLVVGVGNIYANEVLFMMKIDPRTPSYKLTKKQCSLLVEAIKVILKQAIIQGGSSIRDFKSLDGSQGYFATHFSVYKKSQCSVCSSPIIQIKQANRGSFFCEICQK